MKRPGTFGSNTEVYGFAFCYNVQVILIEYPEMSEVTYNEDGETCIKLYKFAKQYAIALE